MYKKPKYYMVIKVMAGSSSKFVDSFLMPCSSSGRMEDGKTFRDKLKELRSNYTVKVIKRKVEHDTVD